MKYCYQCGKITAGEPLFCNFCGRSYDVKLCPRLHVNSRVAEVCSQCGSREFSTPQPRVPFWSKVFGFLLKVAVGFLFVYLGLAFLIAVLKGLLTSPQAQNDLLVLAILFAVLLWLWNRIPQWVKKILRRSIGRKERGNGR